MRARKRNPWWGEGLDKRQARRARRRGGRPIQGQRVTTYYIDEEWEQTLDLRPYIAAISEDVAMLAEAARSSTGRAREVDLGGGVSLRYDPTPEPPAPEPGVTRGYLVWRRPGYTEAMLTDAAMLYGEDGEAVLDVDPVAWRPVTVVDDTGEVTG